MRRLLKIGGVAAAVVAGYVIVASIALAVGIGYLLTAGNVDWAGYTRPAPTDPVEIGYRGDPKAAFGYAFETITYTTELGDAQAWLIPAAEPSDLWAIFVHGIGGLRENGYRMARIFHEAGVPVLMITYRNDRDAPLAADRLYSFGLSEWRDLEAAVGWAKGQGAERIILAGESMGGAIIGQYLKRAADTSPIAGLVLDAPALDFPAVIDASARRLYLPLAGLVSALAQQASALVRTDLRAAQGIEAVAAFKGPIFLAHGRRDPLVPFNISERLFELRPDAIFVANDADRHLFAYHADPAAYQAALVKLIEGARNGVVPPL